MKYNINISMISESLSEAACEDMLSTAPFAESLALDSWNGPATANKIRPSAWSLKRQHGVGLATKHTKIAQMPTGALMQLAAAFGSTIQLVLVYLFLIWPVLEELGQECTVAGQDTSASLPREPARWSWSS